MHKKRLLQTGYQYENTSGGGHILACVREKDGSWSHYDDEHVSRNWKEENMRQAIGEGDLFFYERI